MIVGNGMLANAMKIFEKNEDVLIFASGVSNSSENRQSEFKREFDLLKKHISFPGKIVYFSTVSIFDPSLESTEYIIHKRKIEKYISENSASYIIFRLPIIIGKSNNSNTFFNHFKNKLTANDVVVTKEFAKRYIIGLDDLEKELPEFIGAFNNKTINVAFDNREEVLDLAYKMKEILNSNSAIISNHIHIQSNYIVDNELFLKFSNPIDKEYNYNLLKKYLI